MPDEYSREQLRAWARPDEILLPSEGKRVGEFLDLFALMLGQVGAGPTPTVVQLFGARSMAEIAWAFDRRTSSRQVVEKRRQNGRAAERIDEFADFGDRYRLNNLALDEFDTARRFARVAAGALEVEVTPGVVSFTDEKKKREAG